MPIYLKKSTASQEIPLGMFVDSTDGNTEETGLTIGASDIKLWKNGATSLVNKNSGGATHMSNGIYYAVLDATDTDTDGPLVIFAHISGALYVRLECCVLAANIYDSLIGGTDLLQIDMTQILGTAVSSPATAGILDINVKNIANAAVNTSSAQLGVNVVNAAGTAWGSGAITAASIASNAITSAKIAADAIGASQIAADAIGASEFAQGAADKVWSSASRTLTAISTSLALSVWDVLTANITTASSIGKKIIDWLSGTDTSTPTVNLTKIDGNATNGNNATLNLKKLNVVNNAGDAIVASSTGGNGDGIAASGHGTGDGIYGVGGNTGGDGMRLVGGDNGAYSVAGNALHLKNLSSGCGQNPGEQGSGICIDLNSQTGRGVFIRQAYAGGMGVQIDANGEGMVVTSDSYNGAVVIESTTGPGAVIKTTGNDKDGLKLIGTGTGHDILAKEIGTPVALDGGDASLAGMLTKMADDNGGASFDATTDSLEKIATAEAGATPAIIASAVWDEARSGHTSAGTFGQGVASVQGNVTGAVASVTGAVGSVTADVGITQTGADKVWASAARTLTSFGTLVADIWASATRTLTSFGTLVTDIWAAGTRSLTDKANFSLTTGEEDAIVDKVWDELRSSHTTSGTFGQGSASVQGNVTGNVNGNVNGNVVGSVDSVTDPVTVGTNNDKTGYALTSGERSSIADAVFDEALAGHTGAGTAGKALGDVNTNVGTPVALDSGVATIAGMLTKMADDANGTAFDASSDSLAEIAVGAGGLTSQEVRDAMKLAPTVGSPAAGSVDDHLDNINGDTDAIVAKLPSGTMTDASTMASGFSSLGAGITMLDGKIDIAQIDLDAIAAKLPAGMLSDVTLATTIDGVTLESIWEDLLAMANGRFKINIPEAGKITFYKRDNVTPLFVVNVTDSERTRV